MPPAKKAATAKKGAAEVKPAAKKIAAPAKTAAAPTKKVSAPVKAVAAKSAPPAKNATSKKAPAKTAPPVTITLRQIAAAMAESHELPKKVTESVLGDLVAIATEHLKNGDKVRLTGLGILQIRSREARIGRNPRTGEAVQIAASRKVAFRPSKELKEAV